jgi:hypothetical protein
MPAAGVWWVGAYLVTRASIARHATGVTDPGAARGGRGQPQRMRAEAAVSPRECTISTMTGLWAVRRSDGSAGRSSPVLLDYAFYVEHDPGKALRLKREAMPADWESNPQWLNAFAWWCYERKINFAEAEEIARKAVWTGGGPVLLGLCYLVFGEAGSSTWTTMGRLLSSILSMFARSVARLALLDE